MHDVLHSLAMMQAAQEFTGRKNPKTAEPEDDLNQYRGLLSNHRHTEQTAPNPETNKNSLHIYLPGIMGTDLGMEPIYQQVQATIEEHFPGAEFEGKNSAVSPDTLTKPEKDRFILLARKVSKAIEEGRDVHLYGHSLGAVEVTRVLQLVKQLRPDLWRKGENIDKLHVTLMSPAGFGKDILQTLTMLSRMPEIVLAGSEGSGHIYGLETVSFLPIKAEGASKDTLAVLPAEEQAALVSKFFPEFSQLGSFGGSEKADQVDQVYANPDQATLENRFAILSDEQKQKLYEIDDFILLHAKREDTERVRYYFKLRGDLLSKYTQQTYTGELRTAPTTETPTDTVEKEDQEKTPWFVYIQAALGAGRLLSSYIGGRPYHEMKAWQSKGMDITFLIPEYDVLVKMEEIADFLEDEVEEKSVILRTSTHSDSSIEPSVLREGLTKLFAKALAKTQV